MRTAISASYSTDLTQANTNRLLGAAVNESDECPTAATTTVKDPEIVFGDFSSYVIVDKPGSTSLQYIPALFNTANNLPDGRSGWYLRFRSGADSVNDAAFRRLLDKTSA
jgi:HK97 family phage major capsid protein